MPKGKGYSGGSKRSKTKKGLDMMKKPKKK